MRVKLAICILTMALLRGWLTVSKELSFDEAFTIPLALGILFSKLVASFNVPDVYTASDALSHFMKIGQLPFSGDFSVFLKDLNPPAYFLLMTLWIKLTSLQTLWLRIPSFLAGLVSLYSFYRLLSRFVSKKPALLCTLFTGFSSIHLFYSGLARPYVWIILLALLAINALIDKKPVLYALWMSLGVLTHLFFALLIPVHGLLCWLDKDEAYLNLKTWFQCIIAPMVVGMGWLISVFSLQLGTHADNVIFMPIPVTKLLWHHSVISRWIFYCDKPLPRWSGFELDYLLTAAIWGLLAFYVYKAFSRRNKTKDLHALWILGAVWFFVPMMLLTLFDIFKGAHLSGTERYLFLFSPGLIMMGLAALLSLPEKMRVGVVGVVFALLSLNTYFFIQNDGLPTEQFKAVAQTVNTGFQAGDLVLSMHGYPTLPVVAGYLPKDTPMTTVYKGNDAGIDESRLKSLITPYQRVWLLVTYGQIPSLKPQEEALGILNASGYKLVSKIETGNIRLAGFLLSK